MTEYEIPMMLAEDARKLITIGNKGGFADIYDYHPLAIGNKTFIIPEKTLKEFMKDGFSTESEAENANDIKKMIRDFIGSMFFNGEFKVMSEGELLQKYKALK